MIDFADLGSSARELLYKLFDLLGGSTMRNMLRNYALLVMLAAGCSTEVEPAPEALSKVDAASALNAGTLTYDACARYGWYDDDVCDTFCTQTDTDCSSDGGPVMCAQFIEES